LLELLYHVLLESLLLGWRHHLLLLVSSSHIGCAIASIDTTLDKLLLLLLLLLVLEESYLHRAGRCRR